MSDTTAPSTTFVTLTLNTEPKIVHQKMVDEPEHECCVVSEKQGWRMVRIQRALWRLCTRIVGSYYQETRDALIEAACRGGSYIGFVRTLVSP